MIARLRLPILLCALAALGACGGAPPKPADVKTKISASKDVNPNAEGRASPVHVRIFQLKEDGAFMGADYWALVDKEQQTLGPSLVQRMEQDLAPGEEKQLEMKIDPAANVLAVMAEFANYRSAQWRVTAQAPNKSLMDLVKKDRITIGVEKDKVTLKVGD